MAGTDTMTDSPTTGTLTFTADDAFWTLFPQAHLGAMVVWGIDNTRATGECAALVSEAAQGAAQRLEDADIAARASIAPWRAAYREFGVKPSKYRSSIESLLRSARAGTVPSINPLVDLYNAVSLRFEVPCGGEDLAATRGDIRLTRATGSELFVPLGATEPDPPKVGEIIYRDDAGVLCRCWNWREAERTKLTPHTTAAFLCIEAADAAGAGHVATACDKLLDLVATHLGGHNARAMLTARDRDVTFRMATRPAPPAIA